MQENRSILRGCFCSTAFAGHWVQWWSSVHSCLEMSTGNGHQVCSVLRSYQPLESEKLSSRGLSHLSDALPAWPNFQNQFLIADIQFEPSWPDFWGTLSSHTSSPSQGGGNLQRGSSAITCLYFETPTCVTQWKGRAVLLTCLASDMPSL